MWEYRYLTITWSPCDIRHTRQRAIDVIYHYLQPFFQGLVSFLGLGLSCDGSLVCFLWSSSFPLSRWSPVSHLFWHSKGVAQIFPSSFQYCSLDWLSIYSFKYVLVGDKFIPSDRSLRKLLVWKLASFSSICLIVFHASEQ